MQGSVSCFRCSSKREVLSFLNGQEQKLLLFFAEQKAAQIQKVMKNRPRSQSESDLPLCSNLQNQRPSAGSTDQGSVLMLFQEKKEEETLLCAGRNSRRQQSRSRCAGDTSSFPSWKSYLVTALSKPSSLPHPFSMSLFPFIPPCEQH